jgi:hypothetical protein
MMVARRKRDAQLLEVVLPFIHATLWREDLLAQARSVFVSAGTVHQLRDRILFEVASTRGVKVQFHGP